MWEEEGEEVNYPKELWLNLQNKSQLETGRATGGQLLAAWITVVGFSVVLLSFLSRLW